MSDASPAVVPTPAAPQPGATPPNGAKPPAQKGPAAPTPEARYTIKGKEYTQSELEGLVPRGEESAKLMSAAAKKAQEADRRTAEAEAREALWRSGDTKAIFAELRKLGHDPRKMSEQQILEAMEEEKLTPEQKRMKELEEKLSAKEKAEKDAEEKRAQEAHDAEVGKLVDSLAQRFVDALEAKKIPAKHARTLLPAFADFVRMYEANGEVAPLELIADHLEDAEADLFKRRMGDAEIVDILQRLGPEKSKALLSHAVGEYRTQKANKAGGILPGAPPPKPATPGALPGWLASAPFDVKQAYFSGDENHPDVKAYLAKSKR